MSPDRRSIAMTLGVVLPLLFLVASLTAYTIVLVVEYATTEREP